MKILLVGEYSRLHNSLKEGLTTLGHEAVIVGTGDNFKKYNIDYTIHPYWFSDTWPLRKLKNLTHKLTGINLEETERGLRFYFLLPKLKGFDHVQLINSDALETHPGFAIRLYKKLLKKNKRMGLLICGDETPIIDYYLNDSLKYSILTPYLEDKSPEKQFSYSLKYITKPYRKLFEWVKNNSCCIVTSDMDYELPMKDSKFITHFIPNPVNIHKITYTYPEITDKVVIFLGINRLSYDKKGIGYFEKALEVIKERYADTVEIVVTENVPYSEYIKLYDKAHILLDQVYSYDQGYNALEAMAKGKVVFTGAETEFTQHFNLTEKVAINALPNVDYLINELSNLIENPEDIIAIGKQARAFIEKEHNYIEQAKKYVGVWK